MEEEVERARRPPPLPPAAATLAMFCVFGNDDLLREILLRLVLPTSLLRAALVCKRWYRHASDLAFLHHFRDRHPPRCLGFYISTSGRQLPRFVPFRPLPELAAAARRAGSFFDAFAGSRASVTHSHGSRLLNRTVGAGSADCITCQLCSPLSSAGNALAVQWPPPQPQSPIHGPEGRIYCTFLTDGSDVRSMLSYVLMRVRSIQQEATVWLYELWDMCWVARARVEGHLPVLRLGLDMLFDGSKFYLLVTSNKIHVCDFPSSSISTIDLPEGVDCASRNIRLSRRDDSGIYLLHVKAESLLQVFHGENNNAGNWFLVHSICLRDACKNLAIADWPSPDGHTDVVKIKGVGDNAKFVLLEMFGIVVFLDITTKQAEKLYEMAPEDGDLDRVHPLMLMWPPIFPELKQGFDQ